MPRRLYPAIVHTDDGQNYGASLVDFPIHAGGSSVEEALAEAEIILAEIVDEMVSAKEPLPTPTAIADIPAEDRAGAALVSLVAALVPGKSKVISVTLDEELIQRIDAVAPNRSGFLAEAARQWLSK